MTTTSTPLTGLEASGERFLPEMQGTIALEHVHRYVMAKDLAVGKVVLDIACGEGYGSAILAEAAIHVYGVDIAPDAIAHAQKRYQRSNLTFLTGACARSPSIRPSRCGGDMAGSIHRRKSIISRGERPPTMRPSSSASSTSV